MKNYTFWVYIVTNPTKTTLYTGITNNIARRLVEHYINRGKPNSFAGRYYCYNLIWWEWHQYVFNAIGREKELKRFTRKQKEELIDKFNSERLFYNREICGKWPPDKEMLEAVTSIHN